MSTPDYQLIIIGGGPAGLTAGLYAGRSRLKAVLLEKGAAGGQVLTTGRVDNYPGFPEGISGFDLIDKMTAQAARFDLETRFAPVASMDLDRPVKEIFLEDGGRLTCRAVILATGARPNPLKVPGETELTGKGVSYCGTCDGPFFRDQEIAVVGGGDTAVQEADQLTKFAGRVTVIHRRDQLRAAKIIQEKAFANDRINFIWDTEVIAIEGDTGVQGLRLRRKDGQESALAVTGVFILIGTIPNNETLPLDQLETDGHGFVRTDQEMRTRIPGVMAAGDIRSKAVRQIVNAAGEGAVAALAAESYLHQLS
ncbi:MAG: thioredoxin-disulfide reductase [Desulfobacterales bacterium]|nr:thioredoxin-disulfide reductase [Desulfobacterales bacterium]